MNSPRTARLLALTGPTFAVLFVVIGMVLTGSSPGEKATGQQVTAYYNSHQGRTLATVFLSPLAALLIVLFFSHLRTVARERSLAPGPGPTIMISGAVLWAAGLLGDSVFTLALASTANNGQTDIAQTMNVMNNDSWIPFIGGLAITLVGAGITALGAQLVPRWLGWVSIVAGIVSLAGPWGFLGFFVAPLWMLVVGVLLARPSFINAPARTWPSVERRTRQTA